MRIHARRNLDNRRWSFQYPAMNDADRSVALREAYRLMRGRYGHLAWWPAETPFEVCVGAILTQNTSWTNVEAAIANLKSADVLSPLKMRSLQEGELARLIRPAGYFNVKARRLRSFLRVLFDHFGGDLKLLFAGETSEVRNRLLAINGIGPETADCLLLYASNHASFVIDAYTRRIFERHGWLDHDKTKLSSAKNQVNDRKTYESLKSICEQSLVVSSPAECLEYWQDYHAQLVMVGKDYCRKREARCDSCPLKPLLPRNPKMPHSSA